jgi:single-strand DNA-binding protein
MNKVILCGKLTAQPELRYTTNNTAYSRFNIAVNRLKQKDKEQQADFINCLAWNKLGETISKYFDKGQGILVTGRIQNDSYTDKDGKKRISSYVLVEEIEFVGSKPKETKESKIDSDVFEDFGKSLDDNYLE